MLLVKVNKGKDETEVEIVKENAKSVWLRIKTNGKVIKKKRTDVYEGETVEAPVDIVPTVADEVEVLKTENPEQLVPEETAPVEEEVAPTE